MAKNPAAVALGKRGGRKFVANAPPGTMAELGKKGGKSRWAGMSREEIRVALDKAIRKSAANRKKKARAKARKSKK